MACIYCGNPTTNPKFCSISCSIKHPQDIFLQRLQETGQYYSPDANPGSKAIRKHLIRQNGNKCMICGQSGDNWNGKPMTLIVDHINGKADDWTADNIRLVCPNCDSQLPTYKGRNKGKSTRQFTITQKNRRSQS